MGAVFAAIWSFINSPLGQSVATLVVAWFIKKLGHSSRTDVVSKYAVLAFEAVESLDLPGDKKYLRAVELFVDSMKKAGLGMPTAKEIDLVKHLADQFAQSKKPKPTRVLGKK